MASTDEIRTQSEAWTLEDDATLLKHLRGVSDRLEERSNHVIGKLDTLQESADRTQTRLGTITGQFLLLSHSQFIENRVYDEADPEVEAADGGEKSEASAEEKEKRIKDSIGKALKAGVDFVENAFDRVNFDGSESEDEETSNILEPIFEPRNPYLLRNLPHLIGTIPFMNDEDVGLRCADEEEGQKLQDANDEEFSEDEDEKVPFQRQDDEALSEFSVSENEEEQDNESPNTKSEAFIPQANPPPPTKVTAKSSMFDDSESDNENDLFKSKPPPLLPNLSVESSSRTSRTSEVDEKENARVSDSGENTAMKLPANFARELAQKIGTKAPNKDLPVEEKAPIDREIPPKVVQEIMSPPIPPLASTKPKMKPVGGGGLFDDSDSDSETDSLFKPKANTTEVEKIRKEKETQKPKKLSVNQSLKTNSLFSSEEDFDSLFGKGKAPSLKKIGEKKSASGKTAKSLSSSDDEDDVDFSSLVKGEKVLSSSSSKGFPDTHKGTDSVAIASTVVDTRPKHSILPNDEDSVSSGVTIGAKSTRESPKKVSLFLSSEEDSSIVAYPKKSKRLSKAKTAKASKSLFDDSSSEDELFSKTFSIKSRRKEQEAKSGDNQKEIDTSKSLNQATKGGLFENPSSTAKKSEKLPPVKKAASDLFATDDSEDSDDLFSILKGANKAINNTQEEAKEEIVTTEVEKDISLKPETEIPENKAKSKMGNFLFVSSDEDESESNTEPVIKNELAKDNVEKEVPKSAIAEETSNKSDAEDEADGNLPSRVKSKKEKLSTALKPKKTAMVETVVTEDPLTVKEDLIFDPEHKKERPEDPKEHKEKEKPLEKERKEPNEQGEKVMEKSDAFKNMLAQTLLKGPGGPGMIRPKKGERKLPEEIEQSEENESVPELLPNLGKSRARIHQSVKRRPPTREARRKAATESVLFEESDDAINAKDETDGENRTSSPEDASKIPPPMPEKIESKLFGNSSGSESELFGSAGAKRNQPSALFDENSEDSDSLFSTTK